MLEVVVENKQGIMTSSQYLTVTSLREYNNMIRTIFDEEKLGDDAKRIINETRAALAALEQSTETTRGESSTEAGVRDTGSGTDASVRDAEQTATTV